jgi:hypothetical protein
VGQHLLNNVHVEAGKLDLNLFNFKIGNYEGGKKRIALSKELQDDFVCKLVLKNYCTLRIFGIYLT